jgi:hypothetical protein
LPGGRFSGANIDVSPTPVLSKRGRGGATRFWDAACAEAEDDTAAAKAIAVSPPATRAREKDDMVKRS